MEGIRDRKEEEEKEGEKREKKGEAEKEEERERERKGGMNGRGKKRESVNGCKEGGESRWRWIRKRE